MCLIKAALLCKLCFQGEVNSWDIAPNSEVGDVLRDVRAIPQVNDVVSIVCLSI